MTRPNPLDVLRYHVTGAIERGEKEAIVAVEYWSADGYPIVAGGLYWDNNLRVVRVIKVATHSNPYEEETQTWHLTTGGEADTLSGGLYKYGRLARRFEGKDAADYPVGTSYNEYNHEEEDDEL